MAPKLTVIHGGGNGDRGDHDDVARQGWARHWFADFTVVAAHGLGPFQEHGGMIARLANPPQHAKDPGAGPWGARSTPGSPRSGLTQDEPG
jgi:hypothetical protein